MKEKERKPRSNTETDIIRRIAAAAANYTPEWNFSLENPDIGSTLAYIYADMTEDTLKQLEQLEHKNRLAFFNCLKTELRRASPAGGIAVLSLVQNAPGGTEVDAHTGLTAEVPEDDGGTTRFETTEDLYVTPAQPVCLYLTDGNKDGFYKLSDNLQSQSSSIALFREKGENLQKHELYLAHDEVFGIQGEADIEISLYTRKGQPLKEDLLRALADSENVCFSYWTGERWQEFSQVSAMQESISLQKAALLPAFGRIRLGEADTYAIRCQVRDIAKTGQISVEEILLRSQGSRLVPRYIYGASAECDPKEFLPFGERLNLYEEVYFGSGEALTKRGALVSLSFNLDFIQIPLETAIEDEPVEWKWIMKHSEFRADPEYEITIKEVIWEYYNGNGWSRLFTDSEYSDVFGTGSEMAGRQKTISFICPGDMTPVLVNACETCYIRARILKINNLYKIKGKYMVPVIKNPMFSYDYREMKKPPQILHIENNGEQSMFSVGEFKETGQAIPLFAGLTEKEKCLYLGFRLPPVGSPVRMLWVMEDTLAGQRGAICWEYESSRGFREMNLADLTDHLSRSGPVTIVGPEDFKKSSHFGQEMYWIRLRDESGFYSADNGKLAYPVLQNLWMNAVEIRHMEREVTERFTLDYYKEDCSIKLMYGNIDTILVEVLEGSEEEERWIVWEEVPDLELQPGGGRVCQVDRREGILRFGNGSHGRVPPFGKFEGIRVHYKCAGGSRGNVGPGKVNKLNRTVGFVSNVTNPMPLWGGLDAETPEEAIKRCSARLRHSDRAVTARDYEELAMEASGDLQKVRCFGGINNRGDKEDGAVTLVIYPKKGQEDKTLYYAIQEDIRKYLAPRMDGGILKRHQFYITEPKLVEVWAKAEVTVENFQDIFGVRRMGQERIRAFLDPISGHFDGAGWSIGQFPEVMQLQNILKEIPEVAWISKIYFMTFISGPKGREEVEPESIRRHPFVLPYCKKAEVIVTVKGR
ncbi:MAG: baseplate J/gp47 family protein [Lachnospiraceae bacterium]|nr:baseplate J/gp47 family protein [Lachnospiraceae bacterium]